MDQYSRIILQRSSIQHYILHFFAGIDTQYLSEAEPTKDTAYIALTGFCEYVGESGPL